MSFKKTLVVQTTRNEIDEHEIYDYDSQRTSIDSNDNDLKEHPKVNATTPMSSPQPPTPTMPLSPSIRLLFSFIPRRHLLILVLPAICTSIIAGGVAPFMTYVVGQAFDAFAQFSSFSNDNGPIPQSAKDTLLHNVAIAALELIGLAAGSLMLSSVTSCLWIWIGEMNVASLRKAVYAAVAQKDLMWFDEHLGSAQEDTDNSNNPVGAAGLMAKFSRSTDEVRAASSLSSSYLIQYLTTTLTCLILAFTRSWQLTFVILSAVPLLIIIQGLSQGLANPLLSIERQQTGAAATIVERAVSAIATVKAFNATGLEHTRAATVFRSLQSAAKSLNKLWALTSGISQFVVMAMFVQGFWFGAKLVRDGKASAGDVMSVFWACLIAASNLQMCIPQFIVLAKGKLAMVDLVGVIAPAPPSDGGLPFEKGQPVAPRKIIPPATAGKAKSAGGLGIALHNVSFAYPSRPAHPVLSDISLFLPAGETTFIVGGSGSGKSTISHLLQGMYTPQEGTIMLDEWDLRSLDDTWVREQVGCVGQMGAAGVVIFEGETIFENIALAAAAFPATGNPRPPTAAPIPPPKPVDVEEACRAALMHEFVRDLPEGYHTVLGNSSGVALSGGQKQRLAIARARLRNPPVLILDEATSALDVTSRILVFEALKRWRMGKTTIVITHDLSQITSGDFVYVLKDGQVVEQGYRSDLEGTATTPYNNHQGEFMRMVQAQRETGGGLPKKEFAMTMTSKDSLRSDFRKEENDVPRGLTPHSMAIRPLTFGTWMFDVVADLTSAKANSSANLPPLPTTTSAKRLSRSGPPMEKDKYTKFPETQRRRPSTTYDPSLPTSPSAAHTAPPPQRYSLPAPPTTPTSTTFTMHTHRRMSHVIDGDEDYDAMNTMQLSADALRKARGGVRGGGAERTRWDGTVTSTGTGRRDVALSYIKVDKSSSFEDTLVDEEDEFKHPQPGLWSIIRAVYPSIPHKPLLFLGLAFCVASGAMTPVFSFLLSRLLFEVSVGAQDTSAINIFGGLVLGVAAADGVFLGLKYLIMETCAMSWVTRIRTSALDKILSQDKRWFDSPLHAPPRLVQILVKDGDDARDLIAVVLGQLFVVSAMLGVGLVWAFIRGWQLTLAGLAIAPVFALAMAVQSRLVAGCERRNKGAREVVARGYYETIINIRGIRSMAFDNIFKSQFDAAADTALKTGVRGAFVEGCTYGVATGLIYLAEALLFYVGALLIAREIYTYLQMIEVLNLVVFSVTIGSQLMAFTEKIAKSVQATADFIKFTSLSTDTYESRGTLHPDVSGSIRFNDVKFSYPSRAEAPVLRNLTLRIRQGECVAIVGTSGCGKSTIVSLLQRLYEPDVGSVTIGGVDTRLMSVDHLRDHVSIVSQHPHLFDASIADNIRYGRPGIGDVDVRCAAEAANLHDFIMSLPEGYETHVGENASLISGGQAQRLQIARALARSARILILDECTSSLDAENQAAVLETVKMAKNGRTTVMVTHKLEAMMMCDRILVVQDGEVVEQGTCKALMGKKGVFATLARGGEWIGD